MSVKYHFLCKPIENIRGFESELNKMLSDGWQVKEDIVPRIIRSDSRESDRLFVTLIKGSEKTERHD